MTQNELAKLVASLVAQAMAAQKPAGSKASSTGKSERSLKNETLTISAFKRKLGVKVTPHVDVFSFTKWTERGFRPIEGTKAVKVKNLRLFHKSQVRPMTAEEKAKLAADQKAFASRQPVAKEQQATA